MWPTTIMNESVRSSSKRSCGIVTVVETISSQSSDNVIRFDDDVTTRMPYRVHRACQNPNEWIWLLVTGKTKCINISRPFTKSIYSSISILSINHTWRDGRLQQSTPSFRFLDIFHLPGVWNRRTTYEVALPSLDLLFQLKPTTDNGTTTTSTTTSTPTSTTTMTQRGGAKLVLDGYTYMKKRDLENSRDWICTKRDMRRNGNNRIIGWGWSFQKSIHVKILDDKQV